VVDVVFFSDVRYVDPFRRYSRSKSKVVRNGAKIWTFLAIPNFRKRAFQKLYPHYHRALAARGLEKFREGTPTSREVIEAHTHTLNFRTNFKFSRHSTDSELWSSTSDHSLVFTVGPWDLRDFGFSAKEFMFWFVGLVP